MAVHGESLKRFLPFYKSNSLVDSSSPYNWLQTEKFFANNLHNQPAGSYLLGCNGSPQTGSNATSREPESFFFRCSANFYFIFQLPFTAFQQFRNQVIHE
jgi:hypothetical protein